MEGVMFVLGAVFGASLVSIAVAYVLLSVLRWFQHQPGGRP